MTKIKHAEVFEVIFYDGTPDGVRSYRRIASTVIAYVVPRHLLKNARGIANMDKPGVYFLIGESDSATTRIYIGQTRNGIKRMDDHYANKDFWNKAILFLADAKDFTLDTIAGLEKHTIEKANATVCYKIENGVTPK